MRLPYSSLASTFTTASPPRLASDLVSAEQYNIVRRSSPSQWQPDRVFRMQHREYLIAHTSMRKIASSATALARFLQVGCRQ